MLNCPDCVYDRSIICVIGCFLMGIGIKESHTGVRLSVDNFFRISFKDANKIQRPSGRGVNKPEDDGEVIENTSSDEEVSLKFITKHEYRHHVTGLDRNNYLVFGPSSAISAKWMLFVQKDDHVFLDTCSLVETLICLALVWLASLCSSWWNSLLSQQIDVERIVCTIENHKI